MESKQFTTYRKKNSRTLSSEKELENLSSFNEKEQFNKKDSTFGDIELVNEETEQLVIEIL